MATFNKFNQFVEDLAHGVHDFETDELTVILTNTAPVATNAVAADITAIDHANLSSRVVTVSSAGQTGGVWELVLAQLVLTASGAVPAFRYVVLANNTPAGDPLIGWYDRGSSLTLAENDTLTLTFDDPALTIA